MAKKPKGKKKGKGIPKPVLIVGGVLGAYLLYRWYKNRQATSSTPATGPTLPASGYSDTGSGGGGSAGGGSAPPGTPQPATGSTATGVDYSGTGSVATLDPTATAPAAIQGYDPTTGLLAGQTFNNPFTTDLSGAYAAGMGNGPLVATAPTSFPDSGLVQGVSSGNPTVNNGLPSLRQIVATGTTSGTGAGYTGTGVTGLSPAVLAAAHSRVGG